MKNIKRNVPCIQSAYVAGTTLSEILISLMVMGIGVVSLATLFPISVLRSIQATQLTNSAIHRLNAEQAGKMFPQIVLNPDGDDTTAGPNYLIEHQSPGVRNLDRNTIDNPFSFGGRYIVDPLGFYQMPAAQQHEFGNSNGASVDSTGNTVLRRYFGGFSDLATAKNWAYLSDSWQLQLSGTSPTLNADNSITVSATADTQPAQQTLASSIPVRIILFSANGRTSTTRTVTNITGSNISWSDGDPTTLADNLPSTGYGTIQRYRLESIDPRYSWLLTVRKPEIDSNGRRASVDVVVFHRRAFSAAQEQIYGANLGTGGTTCTVTIPAGTKPFLKKGGFLFDAKHAHWYRILNVVEGASPVVEIDRPAVQATDRVMAMPGIVDVYRLGTISFDEQSAL